MKKIIVDGEEFEIVIKNNMPVVECDKHDKNTVKEFLLEWAKMYQDSNGKRDNIIFDNGFYRYKFFGCCPTFDFLNNEITFHFDSYKEIKE